MDVLSFIETFPQVKIPLLGMVIDPNLQIVLVVLGGILILIGFVGGQVTFFGASVEGVLKNIYLRFTAFLLGAFFISFAIVPGLGLCEKQNPETLLAPFVATNFVSTPSITR